MSVGGLSNQQEQPSATILPDNHYGTQPARNRPKKNVSFMSTSGQKLLEKAKDPVASNPLDHPYGQAPISNIKIARNDRSNVEVTIKGFERLDNSVNMKNSVTMKKFDERIVGKLINRRGNSTVEAPIVKQDAASMSNNDIFDYFQQLSSGS